MRIMIGIKLRKFVLMRITVSMKSAEFCPNPYHCTHSNGNSVKSYTHIAGKRNSTENSSILLNKRSEKVAIWIASIAKMYIFTAFGCTRTPYAAVGRKKERR